MAENVKNVGSPTSTGLLKGGILATTTGKIAVSAVSLLAVAGAGVGGVVVYDNLQDDTQTSKPCLYEEKTFKDGEKFSLNDGCNTCTCVDGQSVCTEKICEQSDENSPIVEDTTNNVENTPFVFTDQGSDLKIRVYYQKTLSSEKELIAEGNSGALSPDKQTIMYTTFNSQDSMDSYVKFYDITTKTIVKEFKEEFVGRAIWSPKGDYIAVDFGTGVQRSVHVYSYPSFELLTTVTTTQSYSWFNDYILIFNEPTKTNVPRPWGSTQGSSVAIYDVAKREKKVIALAEDYVDYGFAAYVTGDRIYYGRAENTAKNDQGWFDKELQSGTFYSCNLEGGDIRVEDISSYVGDKVKKQINLDESTTFLDKVEKHPSLEGWYLISLSYKDTTKPSIISILKLGEPDSYRQVAVGANANW